MPRIRLGVPQGLGVAFGCFVFGCGPNVQMIYEGNVRFEHCYRLDMDPTIAPSHRRACWQDWLDRHTYAQSGDRLSHARQRLTELDNGDQFTISLQLDAGSAGIPTAEAVPMPSSIHDAPPARALEPPSAPSSSPTIPTPKFQVPIPGAECSDKCLGRWGECATSCSDQEKQFTSSANSEAKVATGVSVPASQKIPRDACDTCRHAFRACMQKCYK